MNRDEAQKCYEISRELFRKGDYDRALRLAEKCCRMEPSKEREEWLSEIRSKAPPKSKAADPPQNETRDKSPERSERGASKKEDSKYNGSKGRAYTNEQVKKIKEICSFREKGDLYSVLGLNKKCDFSAVKKAYRKLALQFHPDKCSAPGTDEAFKAIGFAFSILSDEKKRKAYDLNGIRSTSRSGAGGSRDHRDPRTGFAQQGEVFDDDSFATAQYIFDVFFNRGFAAGGPAGVFSFGPGVFMGPGYGVHTFSRGYPYGTAFAQRGSSAARGRNLLILVLTLIIPFIYSLLSSIINGHPPPDYEFFPSLHHSQKHTTHLYGVDYWINGDEWNRWLGSIGVNPNIHVTTTENGRTRKMWAQNAVIPEKLKNYEYNIIRSYRVSLTNACGEERLRKRDLINKSKGLFRTDKKMLARAESMILHNCNLLNDLNNRIRSASGGG